MSVPRLLVCLMVFFASTCALMAHEPGLPSIPSLPPGMIGADFLLPILRPPVSGQLGRTAAVPFATLGPYAIAINESPLPTTRLGASLDYFDLVTASMNRSSATDVRILRHTYSGELADPSGCCSLGIRAPVLHSVVGPEESTQFGDITLVGKYVLYRHTCLVLTGGLALTVPTGPRVPTGERDLNPALIQPFLGGMVLAGDFYLQGFTSLVASTNRKIASLMLNSLGLGYCFWLDDHPVSSWLHGVVLVGEAHTATPLGESGSTSIPVRQFDTAVLTVGVHLLLCHGISLTLATEVPVTGPRPFATDYLAQINWRF